MNQMKFFDTRTKSKLEFQPIDPKNVRVYVCGPTVYDRAHIGNARPAVVFDLLFRLLRHSYGVENVTYVRNITDIDDKINARAAQMRAGGDGRPLLSIIRSVTDETIRWYHEDMDELGVLAPSHEPRATEYLQVMIKMIESLIESGNAYEAEGHVLFSVDSFSEYGSLAHRSVDAMQAGARVEVAPFKRNAMDFVLWKPSSAELPGWDSPWGRGRPGWHIECSAMSLELLGQSFDIHGGGIDLAFPHHENEFAQSHCVNPDGEFARLWMHNGFLQVEGQKMAKSLGNFITVKQLRDQGIEGAVIRLALLSTQYRQPLDWTAAKVEETRTVLRKWRAITANAPADAAPAEAVISALADDLNTPKAISELHKLASQGDGSRLKASAVFMGISMESKTDEISKTLRSRIDGYVRARSEARKRRDFSLADAIRMNLADAGIEVRDGADGAIWQPLDGFDPSKLETLDWAQSGEVDR